MSMSIFHIYFFNMDTVLISVHTCLKTSKDIANTRLEGKMSQKLVDAGIVSNKISMNKKLKMLKICYQIVTFITRIIITYFCNVSPTIINVNQT